MVVNIGQDEYTDLLGEEAGARVVVHPQNRMPFPEDEGFVAKPGKLTSVGLRKVGSNFLFQLVDLNLFCSFWFFRGFFGGVVLFYFWFV